MILALLATGYAADDEVREYKPPPTFALVMPLGVPQFAQRRPLPGLGYMAVQGAGIGFGVYASTRMWQATAIDDLDAERSWRMASWGGIAGGVAGYFVSTLDGSRYNEVHSQAYLERASAWESAQAAAP
ncbi:MAG: hypothetical protein GY913_17255 [Proteobacteria bacterium]|nr:hypothetical protein [Pseudomonadota bacterium]MCP4918654.1 hypothetical protein [Pseudomonadota bacterium]